MKKKCFVSSACCTSECPNIQYDMAEEKYGYGIADDMGLSRVDCKKCVYRTGECKDCLLYRTEDCHGDEGEQE